MEREDDTRFINNRWLTYELGEERELTSDNTLLNCHVHGFIKLRLSKTNTKGVQ